MPRTERGDAKTILITGASTGIGHATALMLDRAGYHVIAGVRRIEDGDSLRNVATDRLETILLDVTAEDQIAGAERFVRERTAGRGLHALINNAGFNYSSPFEFTEEAKARALMEVNFFGVYRLSQAMLPLLRLSRETSGITSKLVNIGSIGSLIGIPWESFYHASKFALLGLSESIRSEIHAQGIRVTVIMPGGIKTPFIAKTRTEMQGALAALPPEGVRLYGKGLTQMGQLTGQVDRVGSSPERVARAITKVVGTRNPPFRVMVGLDARLMNTLRALLPTSDFHWVLRKAFGG